MYNNKVVKFPLCHKEKFSAENVEKVVNPPQKPVIRRNFNALSSFMKSEERIPMRKQPIKFTTKVPKGKTPMFPIFWT